MPDVSKTAFEYDELVLRTIDSALINLVFSLLMFTFASLHSVSFLSADDSSSPAFSQEGYMRVQRKDCKSTNI